MTRNMTFATIFLGAFATWSCGSPDGTSDSTLATHAASDEVTGDAGGDTGEGSDGGKVGKVSDMDGGCAPTSAMK